MTDQSRYPGTPRWVKWLGALVLLAVLAIAVLHLTGYGFGHGMGHSAPPGEPHP